MWEDFQAAQQIHPEGEVIDIEPQGLPAPEPQGLPAPEPQGLPVPEPPEEDPEDPEEPEDNPPIKKNTPIESEYYPFTVPRILYHGTTLKRANDILENGLKPKYAHVAGKGVYTTSDFARAVQYAKERSWGPVPHRPFKMEINDTPIVLEIDVKRLMKEKDPLVTFVPTTKDGRDFDTFVVREVVPPQYISRVVGEGQLNNPSELSFEESIFDKYIPDPATEETKEPKEPVEEKAKDKTPSSDYDKRKKVLELLKEAKEVSDIADKLKGADKREKYSEKRELVKEALEVDKEKFVLTGDDDETGNFLGIEYTPLTFRLHIDKDLTNEYGLKLKPPEIEQ